MIQHIPYPSIEQFRHAIHKISNFVRKTGVDENGDPVYDETKALPALTFEGTVKSHGTNLAIARRRDTNEIWFQSRESIISMVKDNAGAARHFSSISPAFLFDVQGNEVVFYGEWVGKGIQSKVAVSQIPKTFILFDILVDGKFLPKAEVAKVKDYSARVYNIYEFPTWKIEIDFNKPEESQQKLIDITTQVADHCPIGKVFGIDSLGEGVVWRCITPGYEKPEFMFKVKDERHAKHEPKKTDNCDPDEVSKLQDLAGLLTPLWRMDQMIEKACDTNNGGEMDFKFIGNYLKLVNEDIIKEDSDLLNEAGVEFKDVNKYVADVAKKYFLRLINELKEK